ncbi:MAG: hypothetical protein MR209_00060 [Veillonellaceae bacterium]|nr:hypothetical protein [Veillonellaceae bacterium]
MSGVTTVDARGVDISVLQRLGAHMRPHDVEECTAFGVSPVEAVLQSAYHPESESFAVLDEAGEALWVYGRGRARNAGGMGIWCLGRIGSERYARFFLQESKRVLERWLDDGLPLWNYVSVSNDASLRWLAWLGATFGEEVEIGGVRFVRFELRR